MQASLSSSRCNSGLRAHVGRTGSAARVQRVPLCRSVETATAEVATIANVVVSDVGSASLKGTIRKVNEDRFSIQQMKGAAASQPFAFAGVYDRHGGSAVAEWLQSKFYPVIAKAWGSGTPQPERTITEAHVQTDKQLLSTQGGFLGMGERGVGGSKCGATSACVLLYKDTDGSTKLLTANIGDARIVLIRDGKPVQLSVDHVPDSEAERKRIERTNPNPKMPLVRYVAGTWRVGGMLALSRAFGDAYMKGSLQFEGITAGGDGYSSGFGVTSEPYTTLTTLTDKDQFIVVASDGLYAEEERGGGGGLDNETVADIVSSSTASCAELAKVLAATAVEVGSTDDVTLVVMRLAA